MTKERRLYYLTSLKSEAYITACQMRVVGGLYVPWEAYKHYSRLLDKELGYVDTGT